MTATFAGLVALSLILAVLSARGHAHRRPEDFFVAAGQFGGVLFFFLSVGETYSIATVLGYPAGIVARGTGFATWFVGYILLAFPLGYFLAPLIWRAGRRHSAVTLPDLFRGYFASRGLEIVVAGAAFAFLVPLGVIQFIGLNTVLGDLGWPVPPLVLTGLGGALAFAYVAISGIRAPAYVAVLKDALVLGAIVLTGLACLGPPPGGTHPPITVPPPAFGSDVFSMTTIVLQAMGFCVVPQVCAAAFTARSAAAIRRAQVAMPLYMLMFPFLTVAAYYARSHGIRPPAPNDLFLAVARTVLPAPAAGLVLAGAALSALVVLAGTCLALGPLVTRNLVPGLGGDQQRRWAKLVIALYLLLSIAGAAYSAQLIVTINNFFYFGVTQSFPGVLVILAGWRARPVAIGLGLLAGDAIAIGLHAAGAPLGGCNPGLVGLAANFVVVAAGNLQRATKPAKDQSFG